MRFRLEAAKRPLLVNADWNMIGQVLGILLTNAINYSFESGEVVVTTFADEEKGVGFSVTNWGIGITAEELPHVFERFFRGKEATRASVPGTGLGLSIAQEIVQRHGGRIEVQSEGTSGGKTTFTVWLPPFVDEATSRGAHETR